MDDESRLIRAMAKGDRSAWARMYDRHVRDVFAVVYHLLGGDRGLAEDVNQEVWLLAIEQFDRFDPARGKFRDWILGIGRHRALRRHRRAAGAGADEYLDAPAGSLSPPDHLEEIERADLVRVALLRLTEDHRRVLLDKYVAGSSVAEIASQIGYLVAHGGARPRVAEPAENRIRRHHDDGRSTAVAERVLVSRQSASNLLELQGSAAREL